MHSFIDAEKREWPLVVTVGAVKRVRDLVAVDLLEVATGKLLARLADDPVLLADVLFALVKPQADAGKISDEDFGRALVGEVFDRAAEALVKELLDFFPLSQRALALGKLRAEIEKRGRLLDQLERPTCGPRSGGSPASPDATPSTAP
jgi:hypothetical protein